MANFSLGSRVYAWIADAQGQVLWRPGIVVDVSEMGMKFAVLAAGLEEGAGATMTVDLSPSEEALMMIACGALHQLRSAPPAGDEVREAKLLTLGGSPSRSASTVVVLSHSEEAGQL